MVKSDANEATVPQDQEEVGNLRQQKRGQHGGARKGAGRRRGSFSWRTIKDRKMKQKKYNLQLLVESFDADDTEQGRIQEALGLSTDTWTLYLKLRNHFEEGLKQHQTIEWVIDQIKKKESNQLKQKLLEAQKYRFCVSHERVCTRANKIIAKLNLTYLKHTWDPSENEYWFVRYIFRGQRPRKTYRLYYEYIEYVLRVNGEIELKHAQKKATDMIDKKMKDHKVFNNFSKRVRKYFKLKSERVGGKWIWQKK